MRQYRRGWHPEKFDPAQTPSKDVLMVGAETAGLQLLFTERDALAFDAVGPANCLVALVVDGPDPAYGAAVARDGDRFGTVISRCQSPELDRAIGLAIISRDSAGTPGLQVIVDGGTAAASIAPISIVDPEKAPSARVGRCRWSRRRSSRHRL